MAHNPYAPPQADHAHFGSYADEPVRPPLASTGQRFANFMLDSIFRSILTYGVLALLVTIGADGVGMILVLPIIILYYFVPELMFGWTPAKLITGTRVISSDGTKLTAWRVLGRTMCRFVPFEPFSFLSGPPGWHDSWSNTLVVQKS